MASRKLEDCSTPTRACLEEFELQLQGAGIAFVRSCTYRSSDEQNQLYAQGRSAPGLRVTNARGGQSLHNDTLYGEPCSNAADYYPLDGGKLLDNRTDAQVAIWEHLGQIAIACGLEWGGNWIGPLRDMPHVQLNRAAYLEWKAATQE